MKKLGAFALAILMLAACGDGHHVKTDPTVLNRGNGGEPKTFDPAYIDITLENNIVGDMIMPLLTEGPDASPIAGAAESWETSSDGLTWTFHIRPHTWSDGKPVTAEDFVFSFRRTLDPKTASSYAYNIYVIKNAKPVNEGKLPLTALGVRAIDDKTLVIELEHPAAYLPQLLTHSSAFPVPAHIVKAKGKAWSKIGNFVGNGAYIPKEWIPNDHITLVKNPRFYDAKHVRIQTVNYFSIQDANAGLKRMRAGELDTQDPFPSNNILWLRKNMKAELKQESYLSVSYYVVNQTRPPFNDKRVRMAVAMAYDRETMTYKITKLMDPPAYSLVPLGVANYPGGTGFWFKSLPYPQRIAKAQALMREAGYGPNKRLPVTLQTSTNPNSLRIAAAVQSMLRPIYIDAEINQADIAVHYHRLQEQDYDLGGAGWVGDFNDATNFLELAMTGGGNNYGKYSNPKFDDLLDKAQHEPDAIKRGKMLAQAEQIMLDDAAIIPTIYARTSALVRPYVKGWIPNIRDINRTRWLWIDTSQK